MRIIEWIIIAAISLIIVSLGVAGYEGYKTGKAESSSLNKEDFTCTQESKQTQYYPVMIGKIMTQQPRIITVCTKYERVEK